MDHEEVVTLTLNVTAFQKDCLIEALSSYVEGCTIYDDWYLPTNDVLDQLNNE